MKKILILVWSCLSFIVNGQTVTDTVVDIDGNVYKTVKIGDQVWMQENLRVTKFNDGTPLVKDAIQGNCINCHSANWSVVNPMYSIYPNISVIDNGLIYNGTVATSDKNVCPINWHVPTVNDFMILSINTGGQKSWNLTYKDSTSLFKIGVHKHHRPENYYYGEPTTFSRDDFETNLWTSQKVTYINYYEYGITDTIQGQYAFTFLWKAGEISYSKWNNKTNRSENIYYSDITNKLTKTLRGYGYYIRCVHD